MLLVLLFHHLFSIGQGCLSEGYQFLSQWHIDNFANNYPDCKEIEGEVLIGDYSGSSDIYSLEGLSQLTSFGSHVTIAAGENLLSLQGLDSIQHIDGYLFLLRNSEITDFSGLESLRSIGNALAINYNDNLKDLKGLDSLTSIGAELSIGVNNELLNLNGLEQLTSLGTWISIYNNNKLVDISGIRNVDPQSITTKIQIEDNPMLTSCAIWPVCESLNNLDVEMIIGVNGSGCNSVDEIDNECESLFVSEFNQNDILNIFPNPTDRLLNIYSNESMDLESVKIFTQEGRIVSEQTFIGNQIDLSHLNNGIYILEIAAHDYSKFRRLVVKSGSLSSH